jgi:serine/threonine-protein kinase
MEDLIGKTIQNFEIISLLGKGGMGVVYKAYDLNLDRYVALKVLKTDVLGNKGDKERFKKEAKHQAQLSHPNITTVFGFLEYAGTLGIIMEYVEGKSLENIIFNTGKIKLIDAVNILRQALTGIAYAHSKGFIHRDIKPSNIIISDEGKVKIMDFGISKSIREKDPTSPGVKIGTLHYMSPEQILGREVTIRSDIYSLGCTFFETLTGQPPYNFDSEFEILEGHIKKGHSSVSNNIGDIPEIVDKIIEKALRKNAVERYKHCPEMLGDLAKLEETILLAYEESLKKKETKKKRVNLYSIIGFIGFLIIILALTFFAYEQVESFFKSNQLDKIKDNRIGSLFDSDEERTFSNSVRLNSGTVNSLNSISFNNSIQGIITGDKGTILITNDSGNTWSNISLNTLINYYDVYSFNTNEHIIVGDSGSIIFSKNNFQDIDVINVNINNSLFKITFIDSSVGFIIGSEGIILKSNNKGKNWYRVKTNTFENLFDIDFMNESNGIVVGWNGTMLKTTNTGETWNSLRSITNKYFKTVEFINENIGLIAGGNGILFRTADGGLTWNEIELKKQNAIQQLKYVYDSTFLAVGNGGAILISDDLGVTWKYHTSDTYVNFTNFITNVTNDLYIIGANGTILKYY